MAKFKTLQNPWAEGLGNDYEQTLDYVVQKDEKGKTTWRDGIYTKLAYDIKDPEGYNKRTVNIPQSAWGKEFDTIPTSGWKTMSGETDASGLFTSGYATAVSFGLPFSATEDVMTKVFETTADAYYAAPSADKEKIPQGFEVASFRQVNAKEDEEEGD